MVTTCAARRCVVMGEWPFDAREGAQGQSAPPLKRPRASHTNRRWSQPIPIIGFGDHVCICALWILAGSGQYRRWFAPGLYDDPEFGWLICHPRNMRPIPQGRQPSQGPPYSNCSYKPNDGRQASRPPPQRRCFRNNALNASTANACTVESRSCASWRRAHNPSGLILTRTPRPAWEAPPCDLFV
jgi:hypothetical protein